MNISTTEAIALLLKPLAQYTTDEFNFFLAHRDEFQEVGRSKEYYRALSEQMRAEKMVPGATGTSHLNDHVTHASGQRKTVCTSAALAFFNIPPSRYHYSGHAEQDNTILRRHGWSVRSRKSMFKIRRGVSSGVSLAQVRKGLAMGKGERGHYKVSIKTREGFHCIVLSNDGQIVVDTAASLTNNRCKVRDIYLVASK